MRVLVTGSRHGWDQAELERAFGKLFAEWGEYGYLPGVVDELPTLVHGAARGVDTQAKELWEKRGWPTEAHPADWDQFHNAAGPIRNEEMVTSGIDVCVAFMDYHSKGTKDCVRRAKREGIRTMVYHRDEH